jgi:ribosome-binding protein aMBF1 (putative translation factor)
MTEQPRRPPRDEEEAAAFNGLGQAIVLVRERRGMSREDLAAKCDMTPAELETVERGDLDESWGQARRIAQALEMPLPALMSEAEEFAPGPGGEQWRRATRDAEADSAIPGVRSDAAEGGRP